MANNKDEPILIEADLVDQSQTHAVAVRSEMDAMIETAQVHRRKLSIVKESILEMAASDRSVAQSCFYEIPRGGKTISGESVRLAEIVACAYTNLRVASRTVSVDQKTVTVQGICHDLERNTAFMAEVSRRITDSNGKRYKEDMIIMTINAAASIAVRNAIFKCVPKALFKGEFSKIDQVALGTSGDITQARRDAVQRMVSAGATEDEIFGWCSARTQADLTIDNLRSLSRWATALEDNVITLHGLRDELSVRLDPDKKAGSPLSKGSHSTRKPKAEKTSSKPKAQEPAGATKPRQNEPEAPPLDDPVVPEPPEEPEGPPAGSGGLFDQVRKASQSEAEEVDLEPDDQEPMDPDQAKVVWDQAHELLAQSGRLSIPMIQRRLGLSMTDAQSLHSAMINSGAIHENGAAKVKK